MSQKIFSKPNPLSLNNPNSMSKNSNTLPPKSILKHIQPQHHPKKGSTECSLPTNGAHAHFDEMNILQTFHPENKDYGHMKIKEPDTPYNKYLESEMEDDDTEPEQGKVKRGSINYSEVPPIDPVKLSKHLLAKKVAPLKSSVVVDDVTNDEEAEQVKAFKAQRATHYGKEFVKRSDLPADD